METLSDASPGPSQGYLAVVRAAESTFSCLGITCADVKAMVDSSGNALWEACIDPETDSDDDNDGDDDSGWKSVGVAMIVICVLETVGIAAYVGWSLRANKRVFVAPPRT